MILGVWYPEPVVSAQVWTEISILLKKKAKVDQIIYAPRPSRPLGYGFEKNENRDYCEVSPHIIKSYVASSSKLMDRLIESLSFSLICSCKLFFQPKVNLVVNNAWWLPGRFLIALTCKIKQIPYITSVQDIYPEALESRIGKGFSYNFLKAIDRFTLNNAKHVITIEQKMANYLSESRSINLDKFIAIKNWTYSYDFSNRTEPLSNYKQTDFVFLGNLGKASGLECFLRNIPKEWKYSIKIGGSGTEYKVLKKIIESRGLFQISIMKVNTSDSKTFLKSANYGILVVDENINLTSVPSKYLAFVENNLPVLYVGDKTSILAEEIIKNRTGYVCNMDEVFSSKNILINLENINLKNNQSNDLYKRLYLKTLCK